jgi:MoxR-like ATPase
METIPIEAPHAIGDTGVPRILLEELALKTLFLGGEMSLADLAHRMCLSFPVVEQIFQFFRREQLCEVKGMARGTHVIVASGMGRERAAQVLTFNHYVGPAPVSLDDYTSRVRSQSLQRASVQPADLKRAFHRLVLSDDLLNRVGTAVASGTSIFLYGPSGTGKTTLASNIPFIYGDFVLIPHAIQVDRQIIGVYDSGVHRRIEGPEPDDWDRRWVVCHRPCVVAGGELSAEMLELQFNAGTRLFTAPLQLKANNGVLLIDDFGRQRMRHDELLNRWMTPLDRRMDFLSLPGGKKFEVPFDVLVVFSTNLDPRTLADEAFLRRIPNKVNLTYATPEQFAEILRRECQARGLVCEPDLAQYVTQMISDGMRQPLAQSHVRDIVNQILWSASYLGVEPRLTRTTLRQACANYFLPIANV